MSPAWRRDLARYEAALANPDTDEETRAYLTQVVQSMTAAPPQGSSLCLDAVSPSLYDLVLEAYGV